jgi:hypothetical protein
MSIIVKHTCPASVTTAECADPLYRYDCMIILGVVNVYIQYNYVCILCIILYLYYIYTVSILCYCDTYQESFLMERSSLPTSTLVGIEQKHSYMYVCM